MVLVASFFFIFFKKNKFYNFNVVSLQKISCLEFIK